MHGKECIYLSVASIYELKNMKISREGDEQQSVKPVPRSNTQNRSRSTSERNTKNTIMTNYTSTKSNQHTPKKHNFINKNHNNSQQKLNTVKITDMPPPRSAATKFNINRTNEGNCSRCVNVIRLIFSNLFCSRLYSCCKY